MNELIEYGGVPAIVILCYVFIELLKKVIKNESIKNAYPLISAAFGLFLGILLFFTDQPVFFAENAFESAMIGLVSGLSATGGNQIFKRLLKKASDEQEQDDSPARYYITGDKHRDFGGLIDFCKKNKLRQKDVIVILGDTGFNYYGDERDDKLKLALHAIGVTLFCIHGNKENRAENIATYGVKSFCGGIVYYEPRYPNLLFAKDGDVYSFNRKEFIVIGGAHSVDKLRCINEGLPFFEDEMPSDEIKATVERRLEERDNNIYGLLTHTCPTSVLPTEMFVSTSRAAKQNVTKSKKKAIKNEKENYPLDIDRSTEEWLECLKKKLSYEIWYCGHYHIDKELGDIHMIKNEILPFCSHEDEEPKLESLSESI